MFTICCHYPTCGTTFLYIQKPNKTANHIEIYNFLMQNNPKGLDSFDFFEIQEHQLRKQVVTKKKSLRRKVFHLSIKNGRINRQSRLLLLQKTIKTEIQRFEQESLLTKF